MTMPGTAPTHPAQSAQESSSATGSKWTSFLFAALVLVFCCWALSLPLFPTQDGPMHKYYVHVISSLLSGSHAYDMYLIRHPLPPYAIHYAILLGLTKFLSLDLAEKALICLIFVLTAYSFRYCARSIGPGGDGLSLCMVPLVLHWPVVMGFLNYSLAIGLFFLAAGLWIRAGGGIRAGGVRTAGKAPLWLPFVITVIVLTLTHPVPLLLLIAFCGLDLLREVFEDYRNDRSLAGSGERTGFSLRNYRWQFLAFGAACLSFLYPLASADRSRSVANLHSTALHTDGVISGIVLFGISPFDTRSTNLLIDLYRLGLYSILFVCLALAARGWVTRWRAHTLGPGDTMLIGAIAVLIAIPILPQEMNGSDYFAQRLMIFPWLAAMAAAGHDRLPGRLARIAPAFAVVMAALTLLPAEIFIRPVARQLASLEAQPVEDHTGGLAMLDPAMLKAVRVEHQLGFNPYLWSGALPLVHADDVMLNSPWMDLTIMPLQAAEGGHLLIDEMSSTSQAARIINGNIDLPEMPPALRAPLLASAKVIVFIAVPGNVKQGLAPLVGAGEAARYACTDHSWYLVCSARAAQL
jgi:hypothetical protein